jgi:hypothetical protein
MPQLNRFIRRYLLTLMLLSFLVLGQSVDNPPVPDEETPSYQLHALLLKLRGSNYDPLISARATPTLREAFNNATGALTKENIASVLMIIGQKDEIYWSTLSKRAQEIVDSQAPDPVAYDANGKSVRGVISPEFLQWVKDNNIPKDEAESEEMGSFAGELSLMASTGDRRGLPILRKGLSSPNYAVRAMAAQGLAVLQDRDSIPLIINAARQAPSEIQWFIAQPLVSFNDSKALAAADELITDKKLLEDLRQRAKAKGARGLW